MYKRQAEQSGQLSVSLCLVLTSVMNLLSRCVLHVTSACYVRDRWVVDSIERHVAADDMAPLSRSKQTSAPETDAIQFGIGGASNNNRVQPYLVSNVCLTATVL